MTGGAPTARTYHRDLDAWRADYGYRVLGIAVLGLSVGAVFLYVVADAYGITGGLAMGRGLLFPAGVCLVVGGGGAVTLARRPWRFRTLVLDPGARSYEVRTGPRLCRLLRSGCYDDFGSVVLGAKVRKVWGRRYVRTVAFWAVSVVWKDATRRPFCVEEVEGRVVDPPPWGPKPYLGGEHHRAQAALARWAEALGAPAVDETAGAGGGG